MTNKTFTFLLLFYLLSTSLFAQFDFKWAKNLDNDPAYGQNVFIKDQVVDAAGNIYVVGDFKEAADFDPGPSRLDYIPINNARDAFVGKYSRSGDLIWMFPLSTNGVDDALAIALAKDGNVLISGTVNGANMDMDPGPAEFLLPNSLYQGSYFAKYDVSGNFLWVKGLERQTSNGDVYIRDMETDSQGRIVIVGGFTRTVDFDPGPGTAIATANGVTTDFFIARYDSVGNLDFLDVSNFNFSISGYSLFIGPLDEIYMGTNFNGRVYEYSSAGVNTDIHTFSGANIFDIQRDSQGNFIMGGSMNQTVDFDPGPASYLRTSIGLYDLWYGKFDPNFSPIFVRSTGTVGVTYAGVSDIAIDGSDNFCITGYFERQISIGGGLPTIGYSPTTGHNSYIAKFDPSGNGIFVYDYDGSTLYSTSETVEIGLNNEVLYAPTFRGPVDMDPGVGTLNIAAPAADAVLTRLDSAGNLLSAAALGTYPRTFAVDGVMDIAYDHQQNLLVTGYFQETMDFDLGPAEFFLTSNGSQDIFLAKYDTLGTLLFAIAVGGIGPDTAYAVAVDQAGNAYLTGNFSNSVDFAPGAPNLTLTSSGNTDVFLAAYDPSGNLLTAKKMGGSNVDCGRGIGIDTLGNVWLTGLFKGTVDFNPDAGVNSLASSGGGQDIFLAKYNAFGSFILARNVVSSGDDYGTNLCTKGGDVFITGTFTGTADFDLNAGTLIVSSHGGTDAYYARYDGNANLINAFSLGTSGNDFGISVGADDAGNGFITGNYTGTIDLDPGVGTLNHTSAGNYDGFLAKYSPAGTLLFGNSVGGTGLDNVGDLFVNDGGEAYLTGGYIGTATFGPSGGTGTITSTSPSSYDAFIAGYDSTGAYKGATTIGGVPKEWGTAIAVNSTGNVVVGGYHEYRGDFDPGLGVTELMALNTQDGFLTLFRECSGSVAPTTPTLQANPGTVCAGDTVVLKVVSGNLNDANVWQWYSGFCASTPVGQGDSIFVVPSANTTFYARGEGACITPGFCASVSVNIVGGGSSTTYNSLTGCDSIVFHGTTYTTSTVVTENLTSASGCDSTVVTTLTINQPTSGTLTQSGCNSLTINGQTYTTSGTFTQTLTNSAGCDSTLTLNITINQPTSGTFTLSGCNSLTVNGQTYTTSGTFTQTLTNAAGCDSTLTLNLTINQATSGTLTQSGCNSLTINGQTFTNSGTFTQTLTNAAGCDSTLTLNLTINQATFGTLTQSGCNSLTINGQTYTTSGTFTQTLTNAAGCDSILTLNLTLNQATSGSLTQSGCNSLTINGQTYTTSGTFTQTLTNTAGCDSILTLNLTMNQATSGSLTQSGCNSLTINGQTYTTSGTFTQTLTNAAGCDSTLTLNLTINQATSGTLTHTGCNSLTINGQTYTTSGTFTQTLTNAAGCDSTLSLNLTINQATSGTLTQNGCNSLTINGQTFTNSGTFTQMLTNSAGCDSTLTLNLTINQATSGTLTQAGCNSLTINGQTFTNSGTFTQSLTNTAGCDSTLTLNLTINQPTSGSLTQSGCNSLTINGQTYTTSGTFTQTLTNTAGCDSTLTLNLTINQATSGTLTQSGCNSLTINGQTYTNSGTFTQTLTNTAGCDSTLTLNLTINQATSGMLTQSGCNSLTINGQTFTNSGTFTQTLTNAAGCDSTLTLNLTINQATSGTLTQAGCNSLTINGQSFTNSGTFTQTLTNAVGCDSTLTLNLTINQATSGTLTQAGCNSLTINGQTYTNSGTFTQTLTNAAGCDSTLTLNLTINQATSGTLTQSGCTSLTINGQTYTNSGTFTQSLTNAAGCDSTLTLNLTINQATSGTLTQSGCNSLSINGQTYSNSGSFTQTLTNTAGCDSTLTLNLTINQATAGTLTQSGCNSLTINGQTFTNSGTFTQTLTNTAGCDSILTLVLTINQLSAGVILQNNSLVATPLGGTYQWLDCSANFAPIPSATGQFFAPTQDGNYAVEVSMGTCTDTSACMAFILDGLPADAILPQVFLYPNPNQGRAYLDLTEVKGRIELSVTNITGQIINTFSMEGGRVHEWHTDLPDGVYFLQLIGENQWFKHIRLVLQK